MDFTGRKQQKAGKIRRDLLKNFVIFSAIKSCRKSYGHAVCIRYLKSIQNVSRKTSRDVRLELVDC